MYINNHHLFSYHTHAHALLCMNHVYPRYHFMSLMKCYVLYKCTRKCLRVHIVELCTFCRAIAEVFEYQTTNIVIVYSMTSKICCNCSINGSSIMHVHQGWKWVIAKCCARYKILWSCHGHYWPGDLEDD